MAIWKRLHLLLPHFCFQWLLHRCYYLRWQFTAREMVAKNSMFTFIWHTHTHTHKRCDLSGYRTIWYISLCKSISFLPAATEYTIAGASAFCFHFANVDWSDSSFFLFSMLVLLLENSYIPRFVADSIFYGALLILFFVNNFFAQLSQTVLSVHVRFFFTRISFAYFRLRVCFVYNTRIYLS